MHARAFTFSLLALGTVLAACPDVQNARPSASCTKAQERCTLPNGVLGICDLEGADDPPRLICRAQH